MSCRDEGGAPPLLYDIDLVDALFACMDPSGLGYISEEQYRTAMKTLGVSVVLKQSQVEPELGVPFDVYRVDGRISHINSTSTVVFRTSTSFDSATLPYAPSCFGWPRCHISCDVGTSRYRR
ncbi:hypothetical protein M8J76_006294 [Diaphorina citri]|nr:hypothetical protein M8J76_006294 [Diaphorina citri]